jgi:hypothetical protein
VPLALAASAVLRKASSRKETMDITLVGRVILLLPGISSGISDLDL